ncbi:MAG: hypothetical protein QNK04_25780 [Myxococcota bacterium]|nr:hypothetical protein [Myxococcota bacterium]
MSRRGASGRRSACGALWVLLLVLSLALPASAEGPPESESGWERANRAGRTGFDLVILRPFQLGQLVLSAAVFLPSYPISFLFDGDEDVMEVCITDPVARVFQRPLGDL